MASNILVRDIMTKDIHVARNDTSMAEVIATMAKYDLNFMMVIQSEKPTGIITTHDIIVRLLGLGIAPSAVIARMVYTNPLVTINEEGTVEDAIKLMKHWKIKHLPVVNKAEKLIGVLTTNDIVSHVPSMISTLEELCHPKQP